MPDPIAYDDVPFNSTVPAEVRAWVREWEGIWMSPYSLSLYDTGEKGWDHTPEGSLRVSDHWNFKDGEGRMHCRTQGEKPKRGHWCLAVFEGEAYTILKQAKMINGRRDRRRVRKAKSIL